MTHCPAWFQECPSFCPCSGNDCILLLDVGPSKEYCKNSAVPGLAPPPMRYMPLGPDQLVWSCLIAGVSHPGIGFCCSAGVPEIPYHKLYLQRGLAVITDILGKDKGERKIHRVVPRTYRVDILRWCRLCCQTKLPFAVYKCLTTGPGIVFVITCYSGPSSTNCQPVLCVTQPRLFHTWQLNKDV